MPVNDMTVGVGDRQLDPRIAVLESGAPKDGPDCKQAPVFQLRFALTRSCNSWHTSDAGRLEVSWLDPDQWLTAVKTADAKATELRPCEKPPEGPPEQHRIGDMTRGTP